MNHASAEQPPAGLQPCPTRTGFGLENQAAETADGTRANALPRTRELLEELKALPKSSAEHLQKLRQAIEELRHVAREILRGEGQEVLQECSAYVEELFTRGEEDNALYLAGRMPSPDDHDDDHVSLQDKLRRIHHKSLMEKALADSRSQAQTTANDRDTVQEFKRKLDSVMESLDIVVFHARLAHCSEEEQVNEVLKESVFPHLHSRLNEMLRDDKIDQIEECLNIVGQSRSEALQLGVWKATVECRRSLIMLNKALMPVPGQVGYPTIKQRELRMASMSVKSALADDETGETRAALKKLLLSEAVPACFEHSAASALVALRTSVELKVPESEIWSAAATGFQRLPATSRKELSKSLISMCHTRQIVLPDAFIGAELVACRTALRNALADRPGTDLKAALIQVKSADNGKDLCEQDFQKALLRLKQQHNLPDGWDVESMLASKEDKTLLAKAELSNPTVLQAFDTLLKKSTNPVWTRDRRGLVPSRFEAVRVVQVMNATNWSTYVKRRDDVLEDCKKIKCPYDAAFWQGKLNGDLLTRQPSELISRLLPTPPMVPQVNEAWLMHGTNHVGAEAISSKDFDMTRANPAGLYGAGLYLAESVSKSDEYVQGKVVGGVELFPLLICRVCLGNVFYCDERLPDKRKLEQRCLHEEWHSVLGDRKKVSGTFREFIVYDNFMVFPAYIVYYRRVP